MDFVSEITKNQQRQQEINTALKHTEKDYQQSLKELQKKNKELTSCQSTSRSSETLKTGTGTLSYSEKRTWFFQNRPARALLHGRKRVNKIRERHYFLL